MVPNHQPEGNIWDMVNTLNIDGNIMAISHKTPMVQ